MSVVLYKEFASLGSPIESDVLYKVFQNVSPALLELFPLLSCLFKMVVQWMMVGAIGLNAD